MNPAAPALRPYRPEDWPRLCVIHDAARMNELRASVGVQAFLTLEQTAQGEGLFDGELWVAETHGQVQGFVAWGDGELNWLYVDPAAARRGIGRALLRHALAASGGVMRTEVLEGNEPALALYVAEGFHIERHVKGRLTGNESYPAAGFVLSTEPLSAAAASHSAAA